ncbi:MAG: hypothetical protein JRH20_04830 [Deltaproteobacteria bacterium]|nr:hypothetical protein [Deltaproteobacteria bacterium]
MKSVGFLMVGALLVSSGSLLGCGEDPIICITEGAEWFTCNQDKLYRCPMGEGEEVNMLLVTDCAAKGEICYDPLVAEPSCKDPAQKDHIVGADALRYDEQDDTANTLKAGAEDTGYTLDEKGIVIWGSFSPGDTDHYIFNAGSFDRFDLQVFIDGAKAGSSVSIDAVVDDGYSTLSGQGYFINGGLPNSGVNYLLKVSDWVEKPYTIQLKGNP